MTDRASYFKRRVESVDVHGETCYVIPMSGADAESLIKNSGDEDAESIRVLATVFCLCASDETGDRLFSDNDVDEVMAGVALDVLKDVAGKALEVSGMGAELGND